MSDVVLCDDTKSIPLILQQDSDGLGILECISATVTEELNGMYVMEFTIPVLEKHFQSIHVGGIVRCKPNETSDEQLFRIYSITKPMRGIVTVNARHISYDISGIAITPFSATGIDNTISAISSHSLGDNVFTIVTNIHDTTTPFGINVPMSLREVLNGSDGSMLDVFGGEFEWHNDRIRIWQRRGEDRGLEIEYGKNLIDAQMEENIENMYTAVLPYAVISDPDVKNEQKTYTGQLVNITESTRPKVLVVDFSDKYEAEEIPTLETLTAFAQEYIAENNLNEPEVNISVKFIHLFQSLEYKDVLPLQQVFLGDTVSIYFPRLGIDTKSRVEKMVYNVLQDRYDSIQIGDVKSTLGKTVSSISRSVSAGVKSANNHTNKSVAHATEMVTGGLGGNVALQSGQNGHPNELLVMDTASKSSASNVWKFGSNGLAFSGNGVNGSYSSVALTMDGHINGGIIADGSVSKNATAFGGEVDKNARNIQTIANYINQQMVEGGGGNLHIE